MSAKKVAIINVSKGLFDVSLATLGAVAGATGNAPVAGAVALVQASLASNTLKPLLEKKQEEHLELPIPLWWTAEPQLQSWQSVCSRIENRLPVILSNVQQHLQKSQYQQVNYLSAEAIKLLFIDQVIQQLPWEVNAQDRYLVANYVASPLLEKSASVLKTAIDTSRQDAIAQWMSQVADQLNVIQQATLSLNTSIRTNESKGSSSLNPVIGDVSVLQPTPVIVQLVQKQQNNTYDTYISYNQADRKEVMDIVEQLKA